VVILPIFIYSLNQKKDYDNRILYFIIDVLLLCQIFILYCNSLTSLISLMIGFDSKTTQIIYSFWLFIIWIILLKFYSTYFINIKIIHFAIL